MENDLSAGYRAVGFAALVLIVLMCTLGIALPRGMYLDFANFYDAGQKALAGEFGNLYDEFAPIQGAPPLGNMGFLSAPLTSFLHAPFAALPPQVALVLFKIQSTVFLWLGLWLLYRHLVPFVAPADRVRFLAAFAVAALLFQPFWTVYRVGGQTTPLVFLLVVLAWSRHTRGDALLPALCLGVAVMVKPVLAPGLVLLFLAGDMRLRLALVAVGLVLAGISLAIFGPALHLELLQNVGSQSGTLKAAYFNSSLFSWFDPLWFWLSGDDLASAEAQPPELRLAGTLLRLAVLGALAWLYLRWRATGPAPEARRNFTLMLTMTVVPLVATPIAWAHYLSLLFVPLAFVLAFAPQFPPAARGLAWGAILFAVPQNLLIVRRLIARFGMDTWGELFLIGLLKSLAMALTVTLIIVFFQGFARSYDRPGWRSPRAPVRP